MIRRLLLLCVLLLPQLTGALPKPAVLSSDSLRAPRSGNYTFGLWSYSFGDDTAKADPLYSDSSWKELHPLLKVTDFGLNDQRINGIIWFRRHIIVDSSLRDAPLAFIMKQTGASEIYIDGKRIEWYGYVDGKHEDWRFDPHGVPFIHTFHDAGPHLIAVRYVNHEARHDFKAYNNVYAGFQIGVDFADDAIFSRHGSAVTQAVVFLIPFALFIALGFVHLLLFLYYRAERSNFYFSLLSFSLGIGLLMPWILMNTHSPMLALRFSFWSLSIVCIVFVAMSGFMNELFSQTKRRFQLVSAVAAAIIILRFFYVDTAMYGMLLLVVFVSAECTILVVYAMYKRVKGARIIGAGMVLLLALLGSIAVYLFFNSFINLSDSSDTTKLIEGLFALSILSLPVSMSAYLAWRFSAVNKDLKLQLVQVKDLSEKNMEQEFEKQRLLETRQEELEREVAARTSEVREQHEALKGEKKKSDDLLLNILPEEIAEELKENGFSKARLYDEVSVLFTDFVNFTGISEQLSPSALVAELDFCFREFDTIITRHNLEKIKTIGDAYLAVSGLPAINPKHAQDTLNAALEIRDFMLQRKTTQHNTFDIRLGVHSGPVVAGIVGVKKFAYDIWGDTVNTAARMEQHSEAGKINISGATYELVKDDFSCTYRGELEARNKGKMSMYFVEKRN